MPSCEYLHRLYENTLINKSFRNMPIHMFRTLCKMEFFLRQGWDVYILGVLCIMECWHKHACCCSHPRSISAVDVNYLNKSNYLFSCDKLIDSNDYPQGLHRSCMLIPDQFPISDKGRKVVKSISDKGRKVNNTRLIFCLRWAEWLQ